MEFSPPPTEPAKATEEEDLDAAMAVWLKDAEEALADDKLQLDEVDLFVDLASLNRRAKSVGGVMPLLKTPEQSAVFQRLFDMAYDQNMHSEEVDKRVREVFAMQFPQKLSEKEAAEVTKEGTKPSIGSLGIPEHIREGGFLADERERQEELSTFSPQETQNIFWSFSRPGASDEMKEGSRAALLKAISRLSGEAVKYFETDPTGQQMYEDMLMALARSAKTVAERKSFAAELRRVTDKRAGVGISAVEGIDEATTEQLQRALLEARENQARTKSTKRGLVSARLGSLKQRVGRRMQMSLISDLNCAVCRLLLNRLGTQMRWTTSLNQRRFRIRSFYGNSRRQQEAGSAPD